MPVTGHCSWPSVGVGEGAEELRPEWATREPCVGVSSPWGPALGTPQVTWPRSLLCPPHTGCLGVLGKGEPMVTGLGFGPHSRGTPPTCASLTWGLRRSLGSAPPADPPSSCQ